MKRLWILLLLPFLIGAAPSRLNTYTTGTTIEAADVTGNEDAIFDYLTAGVDTYKALSISNAEISTTAAIAETKLSLGTITQAITFTGNNTFAGTTIADLGTVTTVILTSADINGGTIDGVTIGGASAPTVTNLGTVTTADIDGGTLDGVNIGTTTATGELIVNDASDDANGLGAQGTSGQFLQSAGAGANPTWADDNDSSNVLFQKTATTDTCRSIDDTNLSVDGAGTLCRYIAHGTTTNVNVWSSKFKKTAGIDTVTIYVELWGDGSTNTTSGFTIDALAEKEISSTGNSSTVTWYTDTIDVSSLSDGTVYDVTVDIKCTVGSQNCAMGNIIAFGS